MPHDRHEVLLWSPRPVLRERVRVRVISSFGGRSTFEITLTLTLSHEYMGEGTRASVASIRRDD
jgi:hypothetical protein